jgi:hypothetical protein
MGEAKRRKQTDPNYGKKPRPLPQNKKKGFNIRNFDVTKISKTELLIWILLIGVATATFLVTGTLQ